MLARTALALTTSSYDGGNADRVVARGAGDGGRGIRATVGTVGGVAVGDLTSVQGRRGGAEVGVMCHAGRK